jgi:hypothetical protein
MGTIVQRAFYNISVAGTLVENRGSDTNAMFTFTALPPSTVPVSVNYQTVDGSAAAGIDYASRAGALVFSPGVTNLTLNVPVFGNSSVDVRKTFSVVLSQPQNAILSVDQATGTILNDAFTGPLTIAGAQVQGGNVAIQFNSIDGRFYRLERSVDLNMGSWTTVADQIPGNGSVVMVSDAFPSATPRAFYRLILLP